MNFTSPGYRSQLIFTAFDGRAEDRGDHWALHTLSNPNFFWGNLLIFDRPPKRGDYKEWTETFRKEFTNPAVYHVTLAWDSPTGEKGDVSEFIENGFLLESNAVLSATSVVRPPKFNEELDVRIISTSDQWDEMVRIQMASAHSHISAAEWEDFYRKQKLRYQAMEKAGFGHWYGGYFKDRLVAGLGIYHRDRLGRFQTVSTHPDFQRRGFCQSLVYRTSQLALTSGKINELVMCADPDYHAIQIYEAVGFKRRVLEHGVYWWDKSRNPT